MPVVSQGTLTDAEFWDSWTRPGGFRLSSTRWQDYATLYREHPNVRTVVDFLALQVAQLGLHVFRRVSDTDRQRLTEHPLALLIGRPNPSTTKYRLLQAIMSDLGIYGNAYLLKIRAENLQPGVTAPAGMVVLSVPPPLVTVEGGLMPKKYRIDLGTKRVETEPSEVVHFRGYNPDRPTAGLSPLETLRRTLAEEEAAGEYRADYWANAARMSGIIKRPANAPEWSSEAKEQFRAQFESMFNTGGSKVGGTAVFEEGMEFQTISFNPEQSQYAQGRLLTLEETARSYHVPFPMVGINDHTATFASIREMHKMLYQDCLGPPLEMITEEIELQLLPDFPDVEGVYVEFNIAAKLAGSFEEQAEVLQKAVGGPVMTPNEGRALLNLPGLAGDADKLIRPMNVESEPGTEKLKNPPSNARAELESRVLARQRGAVARRLGAGFGSVDEAWDEDRWNRELTLDLALIGESDAANLASDINDRHRALIVAEMEA